MPVGEKTIELWKNPEYREHMAYKASLRVGKLNPDWKGDKVKYSGLHMWIRRKLGTPNKCEHCGTTKAKRFEWSNKKHDYKRRLSDWIRLCCSCHKKYDYRFNS